MKNLQKGSRLTLSITDLNNLGCGVGHAEDGRVVFVKGAVTGDVAEVEIIKVNKSFLVARLLAIQTPSPYRDTTEFCAAPDACGGCVYRHVTYAHELTVKQQYVEHAFRKAGLSEVTVLPVRSTGKTVGYRNKGQYPVGLTKQGIRSGFYAAKTHRLIPTDGCKIQHASFAPVVAAICRFAEQNGWSVYDEITGKGLLRHIYLRIGEQTGQIMVCLVVNGESLPKTDALCEALVEQFPHICDILLNVNRDNTNVVLGKTTHVLWGKDFLEDILCGLRFRIAPDSFYQVNHDGAELLYGLAADAADLRGDELLMDLYCGTGTIGLSMAHKASKLVGVEIVPSAVECAEANAKRNGIENAVFVCADAGDRRVILDAAGGVRPDVVVIDPPRKGSTRELVECLASLEVPKIVYVSCDPDTLARDCVWFREAGYRVGTVQPVDLFPRTGHVECVVLLNREKVEHQMKLHAEPFEMIKSGQKTIELRLNDEKRQKLKVGEVIAFTNIANGETLKRTILKLHHFNSFDELYRTLPLLQCGYTQQDVDTAQASDMEKYYSGEAQAKYGVVGIELSPPNQTTDENVVLLKEKDL